MTSNPSVIEVACWLTARGRDPHMIAAYLAEEERRHKAQAEQAVADFIASVHAQIGVA